MTGSASCLSSSSHFWYWTQLSSPRGPQRLVHTSLRLSRDSNLTSAVAYLPTSAVLPTDIEAGSDRHPCPPHFPRRVLILPDTPFLLTRLAPASCPAHLFPLTRFFYLFYCTIHPDQAPKRVVKTIPYQRPGCPRQRVNIRGSMSIARINRRSSKVRGEVEAQSKRRPSLTSRGASSLGTHQDRTLLGETACVVRR